MATNMTYPQYNILFDSIVNAGCKVNLFSDNRTVKALERKGWIVKNATGTFGFDYTVTIDGYREALRFIVANSCGAVEVEVEKLVHGFASQPRPY